MKGLGVFVSATVLTILGLFSPYGVWSLWHYVIRFWPMGESKNGGLPPAGEPALVFPLFLMAVGLFFGFLFLSALLVKRYIEE